MAQVPSSLADFAQRLLLHEAGKSPRPDDLAGAMEQGCRALHSRLAPLVGATGFDAIIRQAVRLATGDFPFLSAVEPPITNCAVDGFRQSAEGREPKEVGDALTAILANFIWLLVIFIGENIALRKVHEVWPDVPLKSPGSS